MKRKPLKRIRDQRLIGTPGSYVCKLPQFDTKKANTISIRLGLKALARELAGHGPATANVAVRSCWALNQKDFLKAWLFVERCEEGWRRQMALRLLKMILKKRWDLKRPMHRILIKCPWLG